MSLFNYSKNFRSQIFLIKIHQEILLKIINKLQEETNTNSAITETEREILKCSNHAFLQNCNENNEINLLNMVMGTTTKLSTDDDSCSKIGTSDEHSVSDLVNQIDGPKQPILESYPSILIGDHQRKFNKK